MGQVVRHQVVQAQLLQVFKRETYNLSFISFKCSNVGLTISHSFRSQIGMMFYSVRIHCKKGFKRKSVLECDAPTTSVVQG